jgi:hypothetical protein
MERGMAYDWQLSDMKRNANKPSGDKHVIELPQASNRIQVIESDVSITVTSIAERQSNSHSHIPMMPR